MTILHTREVGTRGLPCLKFCKSAFPGRESVNLGCIVIAIAGAGIMGREVDFVCKFNIRTLATSASKKVGKKESNDSLESNDVGTCVGSRHYFVLLLLTKI